MNRTKSNFNTKIRGAEVGRAKLVNAKSEGGLPEVWGEGREGRVLARFLQPRPQMASTDSEQLRYIVCVAPASSRCSGCERVAFCSAECQKLPSVSLLFPPQQCLQTTALLLRRTQLWPLHKTQCGTDVDYFRSPRLSQKKKGEARSLVLIDEHNLAKGSYPFTNKSFTLRDALRRFGVADSSSVKVRFSLFSSFPSVFAFSPSDNPVAQSLVDPLDQNKTLDLEQSKLALLF